MVEYAAPVRVNSGPWAAAYTLERLRNLPVTTKFVLPICSWTSSLGHLMSPDRLLLPPLFHEALDSSLKRRIIQQILQCFPTYGRPEANSRRVEVVELPVEPQPDCAAPRVLAFSVDTAIEEHGPHLPLATDTIQSTFILQQLAKHVDGLEIFHPVDYGQLTWGLPFGFSIDLTANLLAEYVARYTQAVVEWKQPGSVYVVDVHGSITHRQAIVEGLKQIRGTPWAFRWLHEPLADVASGRGDQHAGGVETALVELASPQLLDPDWWPQRLDELARKQMSFQTAVELTPDLDRFCDEVDRNAWNGIIGRIENYSALDARQLSQRMLKMALTDVNRLLDGTMPRDQNAGQQLW